MNNVRKGVGLFHLEGTIEKGVNRETEEDTMKNLLPLLLLSM